MSQDRDSQEEQLTDTNALIAELEQEQPQLFGMDDEQQLQQEQSYYDESAPWLASLPEFVREQVAAQAGKEKQIWFDRDSRMPVVVGYATQDSDYDSMCIYETERDDWGPAFSVVASGEGMPVVELTSQELELVDWDMVYPYFVEAQALWRMLAGIADVADAAEEEEEQEENLKARKKREKKEKEVQKKAEKKAKKEEKKRKEQEKKELKKASKKSKKKDDGDDDDAASDEDDSSGDESGADGSDSDADDVDNAMQGGRKKGGAAAAASISPSSDFFTDFTHDRLPAHATPALKSVAAGCDPAVVKSLVEASRMYNAAWADAHRKGEIMLDYETDYLQQVRSDRVKQVAMARQLQAKLSEFDMSEPSNKALVEGLLNGTHAGARGIREPARIRVEERRDGASNYNHHNRNNRVGFADDAAEENPLHKLISDFKRVPAALRGLEFLGSGGGGGPASSVLGGGSGGGSLLPAPGGAFSSTSAQHHGLLTAAVNDPLMLLSNAPQNERVDVRRVHPRLRTFDDSASTAFGASRDGDSRAGGQSSQPNSSQRGGSQSQMQQQQQQNERERKRERQLFMETATMSSWRQTRDLPNRVTDLDQNNDSNAVRQPHQLSRIKFNQGLATLNRKAEHNLRATTQLRGGATPGTAGGAGTQQDDNMHHQQHQLGLGDFKRQPNTIISLTNFAQRALTAQQEKRNNNNNNNNNNHHYGNTKEDDHEFFARQPLVLGGAISEGYRLPSVGPSEHHLGQPTPQFQDSESFLRARSSSVAYSEGGASQIPVYDEGDLPSFGTVSQQQQLNSNNNNNAGSRSASGMRGRSTSAVSAISEHSHIFDESQLRSVSEQRGSSVQNSNNNNNMGANSSKKGQQQQQSSKTWKQLASVVICRTLTPYLHGTHEKQILIRDHDEFAECARKLTQMAEQAKMRELGLSAALKHAPIPGSEFSDLEAAQLSRGVQTYMESRDKKNKKAGGNRRARSEDSSTRDDEHSREHSESSPFSPGGSGADSSRRSNATPGSRLGAGTPGGFSNSGGGRSNVTHHSESGNFGRI